VKERLTGAIILVALIVLLVPELLTGPIRSTAAPAAASTAAVAPAAHAEPPLRSYTLTLGGAPQAQGDPAATAAQTLAQSAPSAQAGSPEISTQAPPPPTPQDTARALQHSGEPASAGLQAAESPAHPPQDGHASGSSAGWVVQLGSFASRQNAERLARSLAGRGFRMSVSPGRAGSRVLWRVRAGPARDRAGAQHLAARLRALGHHGEVLPVR